MQTSSKLNQEDILSRLFPPHNGEPLPYPDNAEEVLLEVAPDVVLTCRYYSTAKDSPSILFFPATGESASSFDSFAKEFNDAGMNFFLATYRGHENSKSPLTIEAMFADSNKIFNLTAAWLAERSFSGPLFVMGQSLGSVCAIDTVLANPETVKGMILESGISETAPFLKGIGINDDLTNVSEDEGFNNIEKIEKIETPTIIFHASLDTLVTIAQAEKLQASCGARSKQFFVIPRAERDSLASTAGDLYFQTIKKFIDTICGVNSWRRRRKKSKGSESA
jgi:alpha-beta hydrolase superfamily lysophospholipase